MLRYYQRDPAEGLAGTHPRYPRNHVRFAAPLRGLGRLEDALRRRGLHPFTTQRALLAEYDRAAPLDDCLGTREELRAIRRAIATYAAGLDNNPHISGVGQLMLRSSALSDLKNRAQVLRHYHANRSFIEDRGRFDAPLIITGPPRSGTTLLQRLISEDPNTRSPYLFELKTAIPPLAAGADPLRDPRVARGNANAKSIARYAPGYLETVNASHYVSDTEMEESLLYTLAHNGIPTVTAAMAGKAWLDALLVPDDKRPVFRYERLLFKTLDAHRPARSHWTLKAPSYGMFFPLLLEQYPDARIVLTHRNPLVTLPSLCRLWESICLPFDREGAFDKHRFAELVTPAVEQCFDGPFRHLREHEADRGRVLDCVYGDLVADPIAMVERVYRHFGLDYSAEFEERMKAYLRNNRQGKHGRHRYSLEEYGLDAEAFYARHRDYMRAYDFELPRRSHQA